MKHIVIFQGKKFISSKRASKISDYSSDYIGQLCRAGKLEARMFGHSWFITEESLRAHILMTSSPDLFKDRAKNLRAKESQEMMDKDLATENISRVSAKQAANITGYSSDYIGQLCRTGKLDARMFGHTWYVSRESLFGYIRTLEEEQRRAEYEKLTRKAEREAKREEQKTKKSPYGTSYPMATVVVPRPPVSSRIRTIVIAGALVIVVAFGSMSIIYIGGGGNVAVNHSSVAGVYEVTNAVVAFFQRQYEAVVARLIKNRQLTVRTDKTETNTGLEYGMVVAPSSGDPTLDAARTEAIKNTFSDVVNVRPDPSGTAGIITPVFRKTDGKDFMYVLVPVKPHGSAP